MTSTQEMTAEKTGLVPFPVGWAMPFYYASLHCCWAFHKVDKAVLEPYLRDTGLEPTIFTDADGCGLAMTNLQFYTNHNGQFLAIVNEVEFNIVCHPTKNNDTVPDLTIKQWVTGNDQTKLIGGFRVFVPADNHFAVLAGQQVFGEQKFDASFRYNVPCHNNHQDWDGEQPLENPVYQTKWDYSCGDWQFNGGPADAIPHEHLIFRMVIDTKGKTGYPANHSPMTLYAMVQENIQDRGKLNGPHGIDSSVNAALTGSRWNMLGTYEAWFQDDGFTVDTTIGGSTEDETTVSWDDIMNEDAKFGGGGKMRDAMEAILAQGLNGGPAEPVAVLTFQSDPAAIENRAYYV